MWRAERQAGVSLVELMIGLGILAGLVLAVSRFFDNVDTTTRMMDAKSFAGQEMDELLQRFTKDFRAKKQRVNPATGQKEFMWSLLPKGCAAGKCTGVTITRRNPANYDAEQVITYETRCEAVTSLPVLAPVAGELAKVGASCLPKACGGNQRPVVVITGPMPKKFPIYDGSAKKGSTSSRPLAMALCPKAQGGGREISMIVESGTLDAERRIVLHKKNVGLAAGNASGAEILP